MPAVAVIDQPVIICNHMVTYRTTRMATDDTATIWKALSDPTRRQLLDLLHREPMTTGALAASFPVSRIAVMKHLAVLRDAGLVVDRKAGRQRWYYLNAFPLQLLSERWLDPVAGRWASSFARLKHRLEATEQTMSAEQRTDTKLAIDIAQDVKLAAPPAQVFAALVDDPGAWWGLPYINPEATSLILEPRPGGRFFEIWQGGRDDVDGAGALLATVSTFVPERRIELTGPLHMGLVFGVANFTLEEAKGGTMLRFSHRAFGQVEADIAVRIAGGWNELLEARLRAFVERGERHGVAGTQPKN